MLTLFSGLIQVQFLKHYQVQFMNSVTFFEPVEVFFDRSSVQFLNSILYIASKRRKQTQQNNQTAVGSLQKKGDQKAATDVTQCHGKQNQ